MSDTYTRSIPDGAENNLTNTLDFVVRSLISKTINTAIPVRVMSVESNGNGAGYLSAVPLVTARDAQGNSIDAVPIPRLPFVRMYAGRAAIVCDPVPGDIGLAIFAQQDISRVNGQTETPTVAASFRVFDMSDGIYIGGVYNGGGDTNIIFDQSGNITINAPTAITVNAPTATVNSSKTVTVDSPLTTVSGKLVVQGGLAVSGGGGATVSGSMTVSGGDVKADSISLKGHVHGGVQGGPSDTGVAK